MIQYFLFLSFFFPKRSSKQFLKLKNGVLSSFKMLLMFCLLFTTGNLPSVQHVALNSSVTIPCPELSAPEMVFKLYKGSEEICYFSINNTFISKNNNRRDFPASFKVNDTNNSTSVILNNVTVNTTALYTCEAERIFPPPFQKVEHKPQTIVFVEEIQHVCVSTGRPVKSCAVCQHADHLTFWVVLGIMTTYGVIMTCTVLILRVNTYIYI
uniref:Immunoglobulin domain-containing protein n=1 Tax=Cyprinus carpio TaxID=7962 RepID=A0A8C2AM43_CYPCA